MERKELQIITNKNGQRILFVPEYYRKLEYFPLREEYDAILYQGTSGRLIDFQFFQLDPILNYSSQYKPFFLNPKVEGSTIVKLACDGLYVSPDDDGLISEVNRIWDRIKELKINVNEKGAPRSEEALFDRIMRFYLTRNDYVPTPVLKSGSSFGYLYPLIEFYISNKNLSAKYAANRVLLLQSSSYVDTSVLIDRVPLCRSCFRSHQIFTEICPYCKDPDIHLEESIHHFQCANISPESTYVKGDELVCPKCRRKLRHIGVDYDRPTALYNCRICSHSFSKPEMRITCASCGAVSSPDTLLSFPVHEKVYFTLEGMEVFSHSGQINDSSASNPLLVDFEGYQRYLRNRVAIYGLLEKEENAVTVTSIPDVLDKSYLYELCKAMNAIDPTAVFTYRKGTLYIVQLGDNASKLFVNNLEVLNKLCQEMLGIRKFHFDSQVLTSSVEEAEYISTIL